jgi:hypothetical protein
MKKIFSIILTFISISAIAGGPWVPGAKKGYVQIGWSGINYNKVMLDGVNTDVGQTISDYTFQLYGEQGLGERGLLKVVLPYKMIASNNAQSLSGLGNVIVGGKYLLVDKAFKASFGVDLQTGANKKDDKIGFRTGYEALTILPYVSFGQGFNKAYVSADLGYGLMSNNYSNFLKVNAEIGYRVLPKLYTVLTLDVRNPMKNGSFGSNSTAEAKYIKNGLYVNDQMFAGIGLKLNYEVKQDKFGINLSGLGALSMNNVSAAPALNAGFYLKY